MAAPTDPNLGRIERAAQLLGDLTGEVVLVGGAATGLLVTDPAADPVRPTLDVDVIVEAATLAEFGRFEAKLRERGFTQPGIEGDPICRWRLGELILDLMPLDESILGFSNRWYRATFDHAVARELPSGLLLRHVDGPHFLATKLEAYAGRGGGDPVTSHDLEDFVRVVDGRVELQHEMVSAAQELRAFVRAGVRSILADRHFVEALSGYFDAGRDARAKSVRGRLDALAR